MPVSVFECNFLNVFLTLEYLIAEQDGIREQDGILSQIVKPAGWNKRAGWNFVAKS